MENTQKEKIGDLGATEKRYEIEKKNKYNWKQDKDY